MGNLVERAATRLQWYAPLGDQDKFEADVRAVVDLVLEEAARIPELYDEAQNLKTGKRYLIPKGEGNLIGQAYAAAIRSLSSKGGE